MKHCSISVAMVCIMAFAGICLAQSTLSDQKQTGPQLRQRGVAARVSPPDTVTLDMVNKKRTMRHWKFGARYENRATQYYWVAFAEGRSCILTKGMEDSAGVEVMGHCWVGKSGLYKVRLKGEFDRAMAALKNHACFINMMPVAVEEKVSPAIWKQDIRGLAHSQVRPNSSLIKATVFLYEKARVCDIARMVSPYVDSVWCSNIPVYSDTSFSTLIMVAATRQQLLNLAALEQVRTVQEYFIQLPTNDISRTLTRVANIQNPVIDTITFPPTPAWNANRNYTGESVWIGIYDTGIDSDHSDFREQGAGGTILRQATIPNTPSWYYDVDGHGTHVAGIAAGNGWRSGSTRMYGLNNGWNYEWRGVSPKASLWAFDKDIVYMGEAGAIGHAADVNNHSHTLDNDAMYEGWDQEIDQLLTNHSTTAGTHDNNIEVYAVANEGLATTDPRYFVQKGYYSVMADAKNPIKVGSVEKYTGIRSDFSSMGPTRDGRIGPDVMAPGSSGTEVWNVEMDSVAIKRGNTVAKSWEFNTGDQMWGNDWWRQNIRNRSMAGGAFSFITGAETPFIGGCIYSDPIAAPFATTANDSLIIRWRLTKLDTRVPGDSLHLKVYWHVLNDPNAERRNAAGNPLSVEINLKQLSGWQNERIWLNDPRFNGMFGGWAVGDMLQRIRFDFVTCDNRSSGIISCRRTANSYTSMDGTSMAAPHVTGIVGLMLQKYQRTVLTPRGQNIHDNPFWNSTAKALLIHTATDMVCTDFVQGHQNNLDYTDGDYGSEGQQTVVYGVGPDWATGYGLVNAEKALNYVDVNLFREENVEQDEEKYYYIDVPAQTNAMRVTIAWDDPAPTGPVGAYTRTLQNDLDLRLVHVATGAVELPWVLDHSMLNDGTVPGDGIDHLVKRDVILAHPAFKGRDNLNNVEVVDVSSPAAGRWAIVVEGHDITIDQNTTVPGFTQDFSLVADFPITNDNGQISSTTFRLSGNIRARLRFSGDLLLLGDWMHSIGTPNPNDLRFSLSGTLNGYLDAQGSLHELAVYYHDGTWLDNTNLSGMHVYRGSDNRPLMAIGNGFISLRGNWIERSTF
jgi:subtilisin family serine protease